ncbi:MAG: hypothetical protein PHX78_12040 [bacterium]|nr:hypothetical protein [bacterium]
MTEAGFRKKLKIFYLFIILHFILFIPRRAREVFVIFLSCAVNPLLQTLGLVVFFIQALFNSSLIFLAYYLGIGVSAILSRLSGKDYLNLNSKDKSTFWLKKETPNKDVLTLTRQF